MHDISALFAGQGDLHTELTLLGRYLMSVLDQGSELIQVTARSTAAASTHLTDAYTALIDSLYSQLADWINVCAPALEPGDAKRFAVVGINALLGKKATRIVFDAPGVDTPTTNTSATGPRCSPKASNQPNKPIRRPKGPTNGSFSSPPPVPRATNSTSTREVRIQSTVPNSTSVTYR
jgi:hypothetical protein